MENYGILLVDDEPAYHAIVSALVLSRNGTIDSVDSSRAAIEAVRARRYDLILMDINMGVDDGYEAVAAIRAAGWASTVPILAFTTEHLSGGERHYLDAGFDGWLPKPFQAGELMMALQRWIGADRVGTIAAEPPGTKLAALIGHEPAVAMIDRFHANLAEAVDEIDAGGEMQSRGHKLGGLAGTLGFQVLSAAWLSLQHGDGSAWPTVRTLTIEALARHRRSSPSTDGDGIGT